MSALPPIPAVLLSILSVQGGAAIAKGLFPVLGPVGVTGVRITLSALVLALVMRPQLRGLSAQQWRAVIPYGVTLGLMNMAFYLSLARIPLGLAVTLEFVGPLALAVAGSRRKLDYLWALLAALGIALITPWGGGGLDLIGVLLALLAGVGWAAYILLGGRVSQVFSGGQGVATGMLFAALTALPFALVSGVMPRLSPSTLSLGLGIAVLSSALPYTLEMVALRVMPARTFGILMSLEPAVAAICGLLFLHEYLSPEQWLAVGLVIAASAGATLSASKPLPPTEV